MAPVIAFIGASFWGWTASFRRLRAFEDLPRSYIGSCAQGYSRLEGRAALFPGKPLLAPVSPQPCCWYRYVVVTLDTDGSAKSRPTEETDWSFAMKDPAGAQIIAVRSDHYRDQHQAA